MGLHFFQALLPSAQHHYVLVALYLESCVTIACKLAENVHYVETVERIEIK